MKYNMVDVEPEDSLALRPIQNSKEDNFVHKQVNENNGFFNFSATIFVHSNYSHVFIQKCTI